ncbi:MAG: RDD family protein [Desulfamplus sp.]|nr:RDD family protein [Desulfamplus sp.]
MNLNYPTVTRRYFSTFLDSMFILSLFIGIAYALRENTETVSIIRLTIIIMILLFYEPLFTSKFCTVGQKITGIRIRRRIDNHFVRLPVFSAYIRLIVKLLLGIISFFTIPFTKGKRAIHDFAANSVVIPANFSPDTDVMIDN